MSVGGTKVPRIFLKDVVARNPHPTDCLHGVCTISDSAGSPNPFTCRSSLLEPSPHRLPEIELAPERPGTSNISALASVGRDNGWRAANASVGGGRDHRQPCSPGCAQCSD